MGTRTAISVSSALFGKTRQAVLGLLYMNPDNSYYFRQIVRLTGVAQGGVQRELKQLVEAGLVTFVRRGRQTYYQATRECPVFDELRRLMTKTAGLADILRSALKPLSERIRCAFVFGSYARGGAGNSSDVDVIVIGDVGFCEVSEALMAAQSLLGREVNSAVFPESEFAEKARQGTHFISDVLKNAKIFLVGDDNDLKRLAE
jgi:predicted nucleotidyltransferase